MTSRAEPRVTVVMATRNARAAVRLTTHTFAAHTAERVTFVAIDNGSTDGTADDLRSLGWLTFVSFDERRRADPSTPDAVLSSHGATLDWAAARVRTPYLLTLDSDVEFLRDRWLGRLLEEMEGDGSLAAIGPYEPGGRGSQPRLAPHLFLLRTEAVRDLGTSFRGCTVVTDPDEATRWRARPTTWRVDESELATAFPSARLYSTGGLLFEALDASPRWRWRPTPDDVAVAYRHWGHQSWGLTDERVPGAAAFRAAVASDADALEDRLRTLGIGPVAGGGIEPTTSAV
jgi:hypothetical protein